jgi:hypothetical protein
MSRYKRRIIIASVTIHVVAIAGIFIYWLLTPVLELSKEAKATQQPVAEGKANERSSSKKKIPDTGKDPRENYEDGDLSKKAIYDLVLGEGDSNLTKEEQVEKLNQKFGALNTTPVQHVQGAADAVAAAFGVKDEKKSKLPMREVNAQKGIQIDHNSTSLYDFEVVDGKYSLIYKDRYNVYIKGSPTEWKDIDSSTKFRLNLIKKGKQNKKARILLDVTDRLLEVISPREK